MKLTTDQKLLLKYVAHGGCQWWGDARSISFGWRSRGYARAREKAVVALVRKGLLVLEDNHLFLTPLAEKLFKLRQVRHPVEKRSVKMSRTRAARVQ